MKSILLLITAFLYTGHPGNEVLKKINEQAEAENKLIAVYFSGSDWCSNCLRFKNDVLSKPEAGQLLQRDYIYYVADFPQRKKQEKPEKEANKFLAEKLNPEGIFPVLVITDRSWNVKEKIYRASPVEAVVNRLQAHLGK